MKFTEAYKLAMEKSNVFRAHDLRVKECKENGTPSACLLFYICGECFYYGFNGAEIVKGKHTRKRSQYLFENGKTLIIL